MKRILLVVLFFLSALNCLAAEEQVYVPGLLGGTLTGNMDKVSPNPGNLGIDPLGPSASEEPRWPPVPPWAGYTTIVYTGQFFHEGGYCGFYEDIDDRAMLVVDGIVLLDDPNWNVPSAWVGQLSGGWHDFELRMWNSGGGAGRVGPIGFGYDLTGAANGSTEPGYYVHPQNSDAFTADVFRTKLLYPINNALRHTGYHKKPEADMYLDNNGGLMAMAPYGSALLTDGPGGRGLDFNNDQDFIDTGAIGRDDDYMNLFFGCFNAPESGNYEFRNASYDDRCGIWLDLNQDDVFESSAPGLGSDRGEQLSWDDGGTKTVYLEAGSYMFAVTHGEYGGGSQVDVRFKTPAMALQVIIKPSDPAQAGMWSTVPIPVSEPPVADAGEDIIADANEEVILDASLSTDTDGDIVQYTWTALPEEEVLYSGPNSIFKTKALGRVEEVIQLTVTDNTGLKSDDTVSIFNRRVEEIELTPGPEGPQGPQGEQGKQGEQGPQGLQGPPGITPEEIAQMQAQITNLQQENAALLQQIQELQELVEENRKLLERLPQLQKGLKGKQIGLRG